MWVLLLQIYINIDLFAIFGVVFNNWIPMLGFAICPCTWLAIAPVCTMIIATAKCQLLLKPSVTNICRKRFLNAQNLIASESIYTVFSVTSNITRTPRRAVTF